MKIAVITGASSGMGREFVYALDRDEEFDELWVIARREQRLLELKEKCRAKIRPIVLDLQTRESFALYRQLLEQEKPEIAVLVNAAGFGLFGAFMDMDMDRQLDIIDLNSRALTAMCYMSVPYMAKGSRIYNMGSMSSWQPVPYINVYGASKAYVLNFSRALGVELKDRGIKVMAVCPGWITTEFFDHAIHDDTISYFNRYYPPEQVIEKALKDMKKGKNASVLGFPERVQVLLVKHLPVGFVMKTWCKQQGK
ncbi:MAG: SDR family NAD(P)-dependent oxidoreductase [Candidatus Limivicinus sp.]|nr:SDR family NAD(P)-dependent oxidoreductase [Candidatus Limivicinus sp.]